MGGRPEDPRCPECGGPIGLTATYCMHCSTDLTGERGVAEADGNPTWDRNEIDSTGSSGNAGASPGPSRHSTDTSAISSGRVVDALGVSPSGLGERGRAVLAPDGLVDDTFTVVIGIVGGFIVGVVGTVVVGILTESAWAFAVGLVAWLGTTAYLVRRRTVQEAIAKSGYAVAGVLLLVPVIALSPTVSIDGGAGDRVGAFLTLLVFVGIPAGLAAVTGWLASRYVPEGTGEGGD